jgi:Glycosyl hydrolase family 71
MFDEKTNLRWLFFLALTVVLLMAAGCQHAGMHSTLTANHFVSGSSNPVMLAAYQPWFGRPGHINPGYSSQDRVQIEKQIEQAKQLGITGFVVNWYGAHHDFEDKAYTLMQEVAAEKNFKVALMYDEDDSDPAAATEAVIADLQYAHDRYLGPQAVTPRDSYLRYDGRPMIFIFPKAGHTDWNRVRQAVNSWEEPPLLIIKDIRPQYGSAFDGFYAWVTPGPGGWKSDGSNWGQQYLDNFYRTMIANYPNKIAVGAAWPGFNDAKASWSQNRKMSPRCGKTFDDTVRMFRRYYNEQRPLPFLLIETWNDYEEGTAIENGVGACK